jgi:GT2 family glycosyltransferase
MGWETHPEYLVLFPGQDSQASTTTDATALPPPGEILERLIGGPVEEAGPDMGAPRWTPSRRTQSVSVIIPFRDRPELTLRAIASVCTQRFEGEIEIVLVNNQSSDKSLAELATGLSRLSKTIRVTHVDYPKAFNHSRQCNLGAKVARGDILVFLNNDAELVSPDLLDGMSRWSMLDGVATVGCRIESHSGGIVCAGLKARLNAGYDYHSMLEENRDPEYAQFVREVVGNTFACAAVRRDTFQQLGGLDELDFPTGYNDVEFCLRAAQKNYRHLYLGYLVLRHEPGTSRGKSDEVFQKILIRERYPWVLREGMFQLENDRHLLRGNHKAVAQPTASARQSDSIGFGDLLRRTFGRFGG